MVPVEVGNGFEVSGVGRPGAAVKPEVGVAGPHAASAPARAAVMAIDRSRPRVLEAASVRAESIKPILSSNLGASMIHPERPTAPAPWLRQTWAMDHRDHVRLLREGVEGGGPSWADLGSGEGAFTLALAELLGPTGTIHTIDRDGRALKVQLDAIRRTFPGVAVTPLAADFTKPIELPVLDGIVMANSLHFQRDKLAVLGLVTGYLRPGGRLILVEYDADQGNQWVPFPLSFRTWKTLSATAGLRETRRLAAVPSRFLGSIYSALSLR